MTKIEFPPGFVLRTATSTDGPVVRELIYSILRTYGLNPDPNGTDADLADIDGNYHRRGGCFDVLLASGRIIGSVALFPVDGDTVELRKMYLDGAFRGRGLGKMLLEHAMARAKELGFSRVFLETATVLREAVALYKQYGFTSCCGVHAQRCDMAMELDLSRSPSGSEFKL